MWGLPEGVVVNTLYVVEGEVQGLQVGVGLTVEGAPQEHVQLVVLNSHIIFSSMELFELYIYFLYVCIDIDSYDDTEYKVDFWKDRRVTIIRKNLISKVALLI